MAYRIDQSISNICSPIEVLLEGRHPQFENGTEMANTEFDKYYLISKITAKADHIVIELEENKRVNDISWIGEEAVSLF